MNSFRMDLNATFKANLINDNYYSSEKMLANILPIIHSERICSFLLNKFRFFVLVNFTVDSSAPYVEPSARNAY